MFEHRAETEMRLHSEKTARELVLKRHQEQDESAEAGKNDEVTGAPSPADEAHATTETTTTTDAEPTG